MYIRVEILTDTEYLSIKDYNLLHREIIGFTVLMLSISIECET